MKTVLIIYATKEGHTRDVAERVADTLRGLGAEVVTHDLASGPVDPAPFERVVVAASVHLGKHERAMVRFVKNHREVLDAKHAAFMSVAGATAASQQATEPEKRALYASEAKRSVDEFFKQTGWSARHVEYVAGAFLFSKYNWLVRFIMKRIAASEGLSTDTTKDHDYTNWADLDRFAASLTAERY